MKQALFGIAPSSRLISRLTGHVAGGLLTAAVAVTTALISPQAQADEYGDVSQLVRASQWKEALILVDKHLVSRPRDPQMRFLKGVILTESDKPAEAINIFQALTTDFPELPEPYNNLAVLYANQRQLDKARAALEMAIRTNPNYTIAYENLGDIYVKLAVQSYTKARQLDSTNSLTTDNPRKQALLEKVLPQATPSANPASR